MNFYFSLFFLLSGFFFIEKAESAPVFDIKELTDDIFPRTHPCDVGLIYQMLSVIDQLFTEHKIPYWIDGGTALGAVRHQGCIPWDDDADLVYHIEDQERILSLKNEFLKYGYHLSQEEILRLYPSKRKRYPFIDLSGYVLCEDNTYRFDLLSARKIYPRFFWLPEEVEVLVRVPFGPLMLNAPNEMMRYLLAGYGEDCMTHAWFQTPHGKGKHKIVIEEKVRIVDFSPAKYKIHDKHKHKK